MNHWPFFAVHLAGTLFFTIVGLYIASAPRRAFKLLARVGRLGGKFHPSPDWEPRLQLEHRALGLGISLMGFWLLGAESLGLWARYQLSRLPASTLPQANLHSSGDSHLIFLLFLVPFGLYELFRPADQFRSSRKYRSGQLTDDKALRLSIAMQLVGLSVLLGAWTEIWLFTTLQAVRP